MISSSTKFAILTLIVMYAAGCGYDTTRCGSRYLHVYYGDGPGGYRLVVLNDDRSMSFNGIDDYEAYKANSDLKSIFENDNPIGVVCRDTVTFVTDSRPVVDTAPHVAVEIVPPSELIDLKDASFDIVVR